MKIHHLLFALTLALVMPISSAFAQKTDSIDIPVKRLMIHLDTHLSTLNKTLRYGSYGLGFDSFLGKHVYLGADMSNQIEALRNNGIHSNYRTTLLGLYLACLLTVTNIVIFYTNWAIIQQVIKHLATLH